MTVDSIQRAPTTRKRLALFFDGTWNEPPDHTNVRRLRLMLAERDQAGVEQRALYNAGVGTRWYDRLSGGLIGTGLSENVRDGYRWLVENYDEGDEIYLFGFSRGAYTARSLAGIIARCGLLKADAPISFAQLFERYKLGDTVRTLHDLTRDKANSESMDFEEQALLRHAYYRRNLIKLVGVWDTVGSIGLPFGRRTGPCCGRSSGRMCPTRRRRGVRISAGSSSGGFPGRTPMSVAAIATIRCPIDRSSGCSSRPRPAGSPSGKWQARWTANSSKRHATLTMSFSAACGRWESSSGPGARVGIWRR